MAEEFSESEVVFSDNHQLPCAAAEDCPEDQRKGDSGEQKKKRAVAKSSMPVNIPEAMLRRWDSEEAEEEMEPPHVIVGRRVAGKMEFSVCTGHGRTLKGRDLRRVRNSILRLTGFIEA